MVVEVELAPRSKVAVETVIKRPVLSFTAATTVATKGIGNVFLYATVNVITFFEMETLV